MLKWLVVILILVGALALSGVMLQAMGVVDFEQLALEAALSIPAFQSMASTYQRGLDVERVVAEARGEVDSLQVELSERVLALEEERASLAAWAQELDRREQLLDQRERQLTAQGEQLDARSARLQDFDRLLAVYSQMRARDLARIAAELDDSFLIMLLAGLDGRQAADLLTELEPERAARLSVQLGGRSTK